MMGSRSPTMLSRRVARPGFLHQLGRDYPEEHVPILSLMQAVAQYALVWIGRVEDAKYDATSRPM